MQDWTHGKGSRSNLLTLPDRKNRKGGGVFLAIKHYLNPVGQPELDSESEIIWTKIDLPGLKMCLFALFISQRKMTMRVLML